VSSLTWAQAAAWRAHRHHLDQRAPRRDALEVASRLCGLHAQLMSSAELTLWARVKGLEPDAVAVAASGHAHELLPAGTDRARVYRPQGWLTPVLAVDGLMRGVWRHERKGRRLMVEIAPLAKLPKWVREGAEREAELLAGFLGGDLSMSFRA